MSNVAKMQEERKEIRAYAMQMCEELCRKHVPWQIAVETNILVAENLMKHYGAKLNRDYMYYWWFIKEELKTF